MATRESCSKLAVKGIDSFSKTVSDLSFVADLNRAGSIVWNEVRAVLSTYSNIAGTIGVRGSSIQASRKMFIPTLRWILESAKVGIWIFEASQLSVIGFCAKYVPINKRKDDGNRPKRSSAPGMAVIEERLFQCSLSPRLPGLAGGEQHKRCGVRLVKVGLWTPPQ